MFSALLEPPIQSDESHLSAPAHWGVHAHEADHWKAELLRYLKHICLSINVFALDLNSIAHVQLITVDHPLAQLLIKLHDFYYMFSLVYKHKYTERSEIPALIVKFAKKLEGQEKARLIALNNLEWSTSFTQIIFAKMHDWVLYSNQGNKLHTVNGYKEDDLTNFYRILLGLFHYILPVMNDSNLNVRPISNAINLAKIDPNTVEGRLKKLLEVLQQHASRKLPGILLLEDIPRGFTQIYRNFQRQYQNFSYYNSTLENQINFYFDYLPCLGVKHGTLVFLPDFMQDHNEWRSVAEGLQNNYDLLLVDNPGMGLIPSDRSSYTIEEMARMVAKLLRLLDISNPHVIGHGLGACVALELYYHNLCTRDKLVLLNTPWKPFSREKVKQMEGSLRLFAQAQNQPSNSANAQQFFKSYKELYGIKENQQQSSVLPEQHYVIKAGIIDTLQRHWRAYRAYVAKLNPAYFFRLPATAKHNVLLLHSADDPIAPPHFPVQGQHWFSPRSFFVPDAVLVNTLPQAGRDVLIKQPKLIMDQIASHLNFYPVPTRLRRSASFANIKELEEPPSPSPLRREKTI